jgi:hypothetical protein
METKVQIIKPKKKLVIRKEPKKEAPNTNESYIESYIGQLTAQERIVLNIAKEHLETSFDIEKSIGYMTWLKNQKK